MKIFNKKTYKKRKQGGTKDYDLLRKLWEDRLKAPHTRELTKKIKALSVISHGIKRMTEKNRVKRKVQHDKDIASLDRKIKETKGKESRAFKEIKKEEKKKYSNDRKILEKHIDYLSVIQKNVDKHLQEDLALSENISKLAKYTLLANEIKTLYQTKDKADEKKAAKLEKEEDYINGTKLLRTIKEQLSKNEINSERKGILEQIKQEIQDNEDELDDIKKNIHKSVASSSSSRIKFSDASSLHGVAATPASFIADLRRCFDASTTSGIDSRYNRNLFDKLELTPHTPKEGERFNQYDKTHNKYLMIEFNAQRAFNVVPPTGGKVESHITINDNDEKGTKFSSHISIKLYDNTGKEIKDFKRYRTVDSGRQPSDVSRLTILSETNLPCCMRQEDFKKVRAFMRIINKCLNDYNTQREGAFKGGKLKRTKKVKKYK